MFDPTHPLARYLRRSKDFRRDRNVVKTIAFMPDLDDADQRHKASVFETQGLADREIIALGRTWVKTPDGKWPYGYAEIRATHVSVCGLSLEPSPPARHLDICGWPVGEDDSLRVSIAQRLADAATLHLDATRDSDFARGL